MNLSTFLTVSVTIFNFSTILMMLVNILGFPKESTLNKGKHIMTVKFYKVLMSVWHWKNDASYKSHYQNSHGFPVPNLQDNRAELREELFSVPESYKSSSSSTYSIYILFWLHSFIKYIISSKALLFEPSPVLESKAVIAIMFFSNMEISNRTGTLADLPKHVFLTPTRTSI